MKNIHSCHVPVNSEALELKRIMAIAIATSGLLKKQVAIDLGVEPSVLSHWLSEETGFTLPAHMVIRFCASTRNWDLVDYLTTKRPLEGGA